MKDLRAFVLTLFEYAWLPADYQIIKAKFQQLTVVVIYRSPQTDSIAMVLESLLHLVPGTSPAIIFGDFNTDPKRDSVNYNRLNIALASKGFVQIIDKATHLRGGILDHMYVRNINLIDWNLHHPYFSDHDSLAIEFEHFPW